MRLVAELDREKIVCIRVRRPAHGKKSLVIHPESVEISRKKGETVRWVTNEEGAMSISFDTKRGSPFVHELAHGKRQVVSGPALKKAAYGKYKYTVVLRLEKGGKVSKDPDVDVDK